MPGGNEKEMIKRERERMIRKWEKRKVKKRVGLEKTSV